jgi:hypothetical protein
MDFKNRSRLLPDKDRSRRRFRSRPGVEPLEGRALMSATAPAHAKATTTVHATATPPAANQPPENTKREFPPYNISVEINQDSDPAGDDYVFQKQVLVDGYAVPGSTVWLAEGTRPAYFTNITQADYTGHYAFLVPVDFGSTVLQVFAENPAQDYSNVNAVTAFRGNEVVAWNSIALRAIRNLGLPGTEASRDLAVLSAAQYDAVANIDSPNQVDQVHQTAPKGASPDAAADAAAQVVLEALFPSQYGAFQDAYNAAVAGLPATQSTHDGLVLGREVANRTLALRADDGSDTNGILYPSAVPGKWRPTPPEFDGALDPGWAQVTPFLLTSGSEFRPAPPPALNSTAYDQALEQVALLGRSNSTVRTADQTAAAQFWNGEPGSFTDPGHWDEIADIVAIQRKDTLAKDAAIFARLNFAMADAEIAATDAQDTYDLWRPITAIQQVDSTFGSLLDTPPTPSYVSDNAAFAGAASTVLSAAFGAKTSFTDTLYAATGTVVNFPSFNAAAREDGQSRIYGGVNFSFDVTAGLKLGDQIGQDALKKFPGAG